MTFSAASRCMKRLPVASRIIRYMGHRTQSIKTLVIAEHENGDILPGTLSTVTAALKLGGAVDLLVSGHDVKSSAAVSGSKIGGISKVLVLENESLGHKVAENLSKAVFTSNILKDYTHVLASSSVHGKNFFPRLAALCDAAPLSDIIEVVSEDTLKRPMYAGNAIATVKMSDSKKFILVRPTAFEKAAKVDTAAPVESLSISADQAAASLSSFVSESTNKSARPELTTARVVVSGGRGLKSGENFAMLEQLADKLGGAVGASRAAVDAGFVPNDYQVGQTGKVVAPDLYIAVGISGAIQHLSGMKDSKVIVAINKDKEAPIFQVADYGLVDDLFKVVPELNSKL